VHKDFTLDAAGRILPYLADLGISHVYLSPCLQAAPGSMHGYDVTDPSRISEDLGGEQAWERFVEGARRNNLGILIDIVPNHMSATHNNPWWEHVLAHGPFSEYAHFFRYQIAPASPIPGAYLRAGARLWRGFEGGRTEAGHQGWLAASGALRQQLAVGTWLLGRIVVGEWLGAAGYVFRRLEALLEIRSADEEQRQRYEGLAKRAGELLAGARADGRLQAAKEVLDADPERLDAVLQRQYYMLHGWKLPGRWVTTGASST